MTIPSAAQLAREKFIADLSLLLTCAAVKMCVINVIKDNANLDLDANATRCPFCHATATNLVVLNKKQAKRGHAWAQHMLAKRYRCGNQVTESDFEAVRWYRKAAAQGHTTALLELSCHLCSGEGCARDVYKGVECAEKALAIDPGLIDSHGRELLNLGVALNRLRQFEKAIAVFVPLAKDGVTLAKASLALAQCGLGDAYYNTDQMHLALKWYA